MKFDLKSPCSNCPFRKDINPYLNKARVRDLEKSLISKQESFVCHKTSHKLGAPKDKDENHCAGALIVMEKENKPNQMMRIAERLGLYNRHELKNKELVFDSFKEMIKAQPLR